MLGAEQRRLDARPRICLGGALIDRGRAALGLPAAQRPCADARQAARRRDQIPVGGRDRGAQPRLPPLFARDLADLGILGEQGRLRPPADPPRRWARASTESLMLVAERTMVPQLHDVASPFSGTEAA